MTNALSESLTTAASPDRLSEIAAIALPDGVTDALTAAGWGLLAGSALLLGALLGMFWRIPRTAIAVVMAFGSGVLIAAVAYELIAEAHEKAGLPPTLLGTAAGAALYAGGNALLARRGARHRKRSGTLQPAEDEQPGSGAAIALGAVLDGVPESLVIGASLIGGGPVGLATVGAVFISNVPEGLASSAGMRAAGRSRTYVFGLWGGIALLSALCALAGRTLLAGVSPTTLAVVTACAAGAILAMIADTMLPEAHAHTHLTTGLFTTAGFLTAFTLGHL